MNGSLGATTIGYALLLALALVAIALRGAPRPTVLGAALVILELAVIVAAIVDLVALARGQHDADVATNLGYLIVSVAVLPLSVAAVRLDRSRWASVALAVGCVMVAIVSLRLHQTLGAVRG